jgi:integrase/recombinase XerC/integrase/recombinase XerD
MYVEDLDLRPDDEHARVHGKGGTVRTVLLDDRGYVALLKLYLARSGYTSGPLFRASINGRRRSAVLRRGAQPVEEVLRRRRHRDRHPPAPPRARHRAESGVSIEVVRRRLGHASTETTQVYTLLADKVADAEIRAARRKRETRRR